ncbi:MAG: phytanoyl-CoA dioxygenase family protein, partial [Nitrospirota bacterium]|nr:phytanoyl-CoA dioxygenase family protein [Nitrospirota bacterium]
MGGECRMTGPGWLLGFQCVEEPPDAVCVPAKAGSIVVFSSLTPHATGPNRTSSPRKTYIVQY